MSYMNIGKDSIDESGRTGAGTVGTSAAQLAMADTTPLLSGVRIKADALNSNAIYVGFHNGVTSSNGYKLAAGDELPIAISSAVAVWIIGGAASQAYSWIGQ